MLTRFQRFTRVGLLVCAMGATGCGSHSAGEKAPERAPRAGERGLAGAWRWVESQRGGKVVRPVSAEDSMVLVLGRLGTYREHTRESSLKGRYAFARGHLYRLQDTSYTVLLIDSSRFFPSEASYGAAIAIRSFSGDTLVVSGTGTDATFYTFVPADAP